MGNECIEILSGNQLIALENFPSKQTVNVKARGT
jgi:hypothetical protein